MKRTIHEVMDLLEQKRENAKLEMERVYKEEVKPLDYVHYHPDINRLKGEYDAYTDVICLIASSHLLEGEEK